MKIVVGSDHAGFDLKQDVGAMLRKDGHDVLDALVGRVHVVAERGADAGDLVGGDADADAAAADEHAAIGLAGDDRFAGLQGEVGIIDGTVAAVGAAIDDGFAGGFDIGLHAGLEWETTVVAT